MQQRQKNLHKSVEKCNKEKKIFIKLPKNATKIKKNLHKSAQKKNKNKKSRSTYLANYRIFV